MTILHGKDKEIMIRNILGSITVLNLEKEIFKCLVTNHLSLNDVTEVLKVSAKAAEAITRER